MIRVTPVCRRTEVVLALVTVVTFFIVLPLLCRSWPQSVYYQGPQSTDDSPERVQSRSYLDRVGLTLVRNQPAKAFGTLSILVTVVTVRRPNFYLSRVVASLHRLTAGYDDVGVLICNVDAEPELHDEAAEMGKIFPMVQRPLSDLQFGNLFEKEKDDYVFCLNESRSRSRAKNIIVLQDDAVPVNDFLPVVRYFFSYLEERHPDFLYLKLYHPERLQGNVQPEPWRWAEWLAVSVILAHIPARIFRCRYFLFWTGYFMLLVECIGRPHLIQLRRFFSPVLYSLLSATECCSPAVAFTNASALRVAEFLSSITCRKGYAHDTALYEHFRKSRGAIEAFVVEPNLVQHIGFKSSLRG